MDHKHKILCQLKDRKHRNKFKMLFNKGHKTNHKYNSQVNELK